MDKTTKLIFWQRITIGVLLFVSLSTAMMAFNARRQESFWRKEIGMSDSEIGELERRHDNDQKRIQTDTLVMADMSEKLQQYEAKFGPMSWRKGYAHQATIERLLRAGKPLQSEFKHNAMESR